MSKNKILYKIRHKKTGMFYKPLGWDSSHLSKTGKTYANMPNIDWLYCIAEKGERSKPKDWGIVKYEVKEIEVIPILRP